MSFENKLNQRLISEASLDDVGAAAAKRGLRKKKPQEFADVRKALRRPMVQLDAAVHQIDKFLNTTQQDPSRLDSTVAEIEKAFNSLFEPLKAVRAGVQNLRLSANTMKSAGFEYAGEKPGAQQAPAPQQAAQGAKPGVDENRFFNRVATSIEAMNRQEDKMMAAKQGFEAYQQQGGKMNRGEFMRALVQRLRPPAEEQPALPSAAGAKQYGQQGRRRGELQYHPARTSPIESVQHDLGRLVPEPNESQLLNKITTEIEMVNNPADKQNTLRNGWLEYKGAGGRMDYSEFSRAILSRLKRALPQESSVQRRRLV